ncbi:hypothetical protein V493_01343 [Pseudogymnoascus sp. VKM F-4281 (FW-2241)]|nr:hypothetical protein V493_01343 [Pseudogymnoascus sp. VKM F-4281 (FW-2241)]
MACADLTVACVHPRTGGRRDVMIAQALISAAAQGNPNPNAAETFGSRTRWRGAGAVLARKRWRDGRERRRCGRTGKVHAAYPNPVRCPLLVFLDGGYLPTPYDTHTLPSTLAMDYGATIAILGALPALCGT